MNARKLVLGAAIAGIVSAASMVTAPVAQAKDKVHCGGVNACKGKSGCATADNQCKGQNTCKGKGWVEMSAKACAKKNGTVMSAAPATK